eukprot:561517-Amphidinium_carterae.1
MGQFRPEWRPLPIRRRDRSHGMANELHLNKIDFQGCAVGLTSKSAFWQQILGLLYRFGSKRVWEQKSNVLVATSYRSERLAKYNQLVSRGAPSAIKPSPTSGANSTNVKITTVHFELSLH